MYQLQTRYLQSQVNVPVCVTRKELGGGGGVLILQEGQGVGSVVEVGMGESGV